MTYSRFPDGARFSSFRVEGCDKNRTSVDFCSTDLNNTDIASVACSNYGYGSGKMYSGLHA